jgi:phosphoribosyl 1,2-cyclic phosphodiesterase
LRVRSLYSGSSGNAYLLQTERATILIDAGGSRRRLVQALAACGVRPTDIAAILVTHEHSDHVGALRLLQRECPAQIVANAATLDAAGLANGAVTELSTGATVEIADFAVTSFATPHDATASAGYVVRADGCTVALATDLGHAPPAVVERLRGADLLILEANHDVELLHSGRYPQHLKARILGPRGHLSNDQCAATALAVLSGRPQHLWLAHLSADNNRPALARATVAEALRQAGAEAVGVEVLDRYHPGPLFESAVEAWQRRLL